MKGTLTRRFLERSLVGVRGKVAGDTHANEAAGVEKVSRM